MKGHGGHRGGKPVGIEPAIERGFDRGRRSHHPYPQNRAQGTLGKTGQALRLSVNQTRDGPADLPLAPAKAGIRYSRQKDRTPDLLDQAERFRVVQRAALV